MRVFPQILSFQRGKETNAWIEMLNICDKPSTKRNLRHPLTTTPRPILRSRLGFGGIVTELSDVPFLNYVKSAQWKKQKNKKTMSYHHLQHFSCQDLINWSSCCTLSLGSLYSFHCSPSASPHKPRTRLRRKGEAYRRICWSWSMFACRPN